MQTLAANSKAAAAFSPELWRPPPCNLPSVAEHVGPLARHSSACPPQHMKASATAVLDGGNESQMAKCFVCMCASEFLAT